MAVTDSEVAALRDWVDDPRWELATGTAGGKSGTAGTTRPVSKGFRVLSRAAFTIAIRRRLGPACTVADVVRFVANARASHRGLADVLDPRVAEWVIRYATRQPVYDNHDRDAKLSAGLDLLRVLVFELELDSVGVEDLLTEARCLADRWIANQGR